MELIEAKLSGEWKEVWKRCILSISGIAESDFEKWTNEPIESPFLTIDWENEPDYYLSKNGKVYSKVLSTNEIIRKIENGEISSNEEFVKLGYVFNITTDMILMFPDKPWSWIHLSSHPNMTMEFILNNPQFGWEWTAISGDNENVTIDFVLNNLNLPWNWLALTQNKNISMRDKLNNNHMQWFWLFATYELDFEWDDVLKYPNISPHFQLRWNWAKISEHPNITMEIIKHNLDKPWNWKYVCKNAFQKDTDTHVANGIMRLQLATIHEQINEHATNGNRHYTFAGAERVFLDEYLMKYVMQY